MNRLQRHAALAAKLAAFDDQSLATLVENARSLHAGIGGSSSLLTVEGAPVFVKKLPLTDLERQPEHRQSTANLFGMPLFCQYGIGGPNLGAPFGAWRELAANTLATGWVLAGECPSFPVLYHWRVLPKAKPAPMNAAELVECESGVQFWDNSPAVRRRITAIHDASAQLVLFSEYVPQNLLVWLSSELSKGAAAGTKAIAFVEKNLWSTNAFMQARGLTHFDAHFENIMTDGRELYFSDFGLAMATGFALTDADREFLARHRSYDYCRAGVGFLHCITAAFFGEGAWKENLARYLNTGEPKVLPAAAAVVDWMAPAVLAFLEFSRQLRESSKKTPYPAAELESLLATAGLFAG